MIAISYSQENALLVILYSTQKPLDSDADNEAALQAQRTIDQECSSHRGGFVILLHPTDDYPKPNANWRRRFADFTENLRSAKGSVALVTGSTLLRGVITLVNWIQKGSRCENAAFATLHEAIGWLEARRGEKLPRLSEMHKEAYQKLYPAIQAKLS